MKILAILEHAWDADAFLEAASKRPELKPGDFTVFCPDKDAREKVCEAGYSPAVETDYFFPDASTGVSDRAYFLAGNWWKIFYSQEPLLHPSGLNIPALIERDAIYFFLWVLRTVSFIQQLIKAVKPAEVWASVPVKREEFYFRGGLEESLYGAVALDIARAQNLPSKILKTPGCINLKNTLTYPFRRTAFHFAGVRLREKLVRANVSAKELAAAFLRDLIAAAALKLVKSGAEKESILVSASENHVAPVVNELKARGERLSFLRETFSPAQGSSMSRQGAGFVTASPGFSGRASGKLAAFWNSQQEWILKDPLYSWNGYHFGHLLHGKFRFVFSNLFPALIDFQAKLRRILSEGKYSRILVEEDACTFNKTLLRTANQEAIPSMVVQHGFAVLQVGFAPLSATCFAAYGEAAKRRLTDWGVDDSRIAVTGNPLHDRREQEMPPREEFCRNLGLDPGRKIVLLGMFPYRDYSVADFPEVESYSANYFRIIETAARAMKSFPEAQLIIKLHPRDSKLSECASFMKSHYPEVRAVAAQKGPSVHYSAHCDVLVTVLSTLLIDTLPFKKPMIVVDFSGQPAQKTREMISMDIPVVPNDVQLLTEEIRTAFTGTDTAKLESIARDHLHLMDGQAAKRITDTFLNLTAQDSVLQAR